MFTRVLEFTPKPDKIHDLTNTINQHILPMLRKYPDFVDMMTLTPTEHTHHFMALTFWKTREMAEQYHRMDFPKVAEMIKPFLMDTPKVTFFTVETSTFHQIAVAA